MSETEELVNRLQEEVSSFDEYQELEEAKEEYENDSEAQDILVRIRQKENELEIAHNNNEDHNEHQEVHEQLAELEQELDQLDVVQRYYQAAENFQERLDEEVNQHFDIMEIMV